MPNLKHCIECDKPVHGKDTMCESCRKDYHDAEAHWAMSLVEEYEATTADKYNTEYLDSLANEKG